MRRCAFRRLSASERARRRSARARARALGPGPRPSARRPPRIHRRAQVMALESNVQQFSLPYFGMTDKRQGIVHIIGPEQARERAPGRARAAAGARLSPVWRSARRLLTLAPSRPPLASLSQGLALAGPRVAGHVTHHTT